MVKFALISQVINYKIRFSIVELEGYALLFCILR